MAGQYNQGTPLRDLDAADASNVGANPSALNCPD